MIWIILHVYDIRQSFLSKKFYILRRYSSPSPLVMLRSWFLGGMVLYKYYLMHHITHFVAFDITYHILFISNKFNVLSWNYIVISYCMVDIVDPSSKKDSEVQTNNEMLKMLILMYVYNTFFSFMILCIW